MQSVISVGCTYIGKDLCSTSLIKQLLVLYIQLSGSYITPCNITVENRNGGSESIVQAVILIEQRLERIYDSLVIRAVKIISRIKTYGRKTFCSSFFQNKVGNINLLLR